jgi:hypothetical protein
MRQVVDRELGKLLNVFGQKHEDIKIDYDGLEERFGSQTEPELKTRSKLQ